MSTKSKTRSASPPSPTPSWPDELERSNTFICPDADDTGTDTENNTCPNRQGQPNVINLGAQDLDADPTWNFDTSSSSRTGTPLGADRPESALYQGEPTNPARSISNPTVILVETQESNATKRRRESNRNSQRAFRERKERHRQYLEQQLQTLQGQYKDLLELSTMQAGNIDRLRAQIAGLTAELNSAHLGGGFFGGHGAGYQGGDVDFVFDGPGFQGMGPGPGHMSGGSSSQR